MVQRTVRRELLPAVCDAARLIPYLLPWAPLFVFSALLVVYYPTLTVFNVHLASHVPTWIVGPVIVLATRLWGRFIGR